MSAFDLTPDQRRERGTQLCQALAADVAKVAPKGIGTWARAWEITAPADAEFMAALTAWEADPSPAALEHVRIAYDAVLASWRVATSTWRALRGVNR